MIPFGVVMTSAAVVKQGTKLGLVPLSLRDAPSFIEAQFPVGRLSAEAYKERKAGAGQTLTALGSYWKGRKPLILVRAVVLGALLPATDNPAKDLDIFLKLMAMDDEGVGRRIKPLKASDIDPSWPDVDQYVSFESSKPKWLAKVDEEVLARLVEDWFPTIPYERRLRFCKRPEECDEAELLADIWPEVNRHLGSDASSITELVEQLGIARFGHRPRLADTFCGGGSIPFEAARMGCDVYASDLNPIACMLTWGAFNVIGASPERRAEIERAQKQIAAVVDDEITRLGIEHDKDGNRAKAFIYCLETRCPKTEWMVPMAPSWIIATNRRIVAKLVPDRAAKRYHIEVHTGVSAAEMEEAMEGTLRDGRLVHPMNPERSGVEIKTIRGDYRDANGVNRNRLRSWQKSDFMPRPDDIWQERLYAIQWITKDSLDESRQETFFAAVTDDDLSRERQVEVIVRKNLAQWQDEGLVPDMPIEPGDKTDEPIRTRGWTHWHHLFSARQLLFNAIAVRRSKKHAGLFCILPKLLNRQSKLCMYDARNDAAKREPTIQNTFSNQALNTMYVYGVRGSIYAIPHLAHESLSFPIRASATIEGIDVRNLSTFSDFFITDPPYADAINYHEITEYFIAWLRKNPPPPFDQWLWDSRRNLAIKGKDEAFRRDMVAAYAAMTHHMPNNGLQVVMFTHQDAAVWADLGAILWAAGLRVTSAWNVVTETTGALKEGNYVQGTVCLVLRKRLTEANARRMEIEAEIEEAVAQQLARLTALDEAWTAETLYTDGDLTLAAYAAALQVVTSYSTIDRQPLDRDLYRKLDKGERTMIRDLVEYAAQVANGLLVPTGFPRDAWRDLGPAERFYVRMLDMEAKGATKVADFQNFAKSFAYGDYTTLMASTAANAASLAGAADLKGRMLDGEGFAETQLRQVLFAIWKTLEKGDPKLGVTTLRTEYAADYWRRRQKLIGLAEYVAAKTKTTRPEESTAAHELSEALKLDRV
jgi:putative DNA methylase